MNRDLSEQVRGGQELGEDNPILQKLEQSRLNSTETQKQLQELQSAKFGTVLLQLMHRTGNNSEIANNLNAFLDALNFQSESGESSKDLHEGRQKDISDFLGEAAKALRGRVGAMPKTAEKVDLSRWSDKQ